VGRIAIFAAFLLVSGAFADTTYVSGIVSGTWTPDGNPYIVTADLEIPPRRDLDVHNGVQILFNGHRLTVLGSLICWPGPDSTRFTQDMAAFPSRWPGIFIRTPDASAEFRKAIIEHSMGIHADTTSVDLWESTLRDNASTSLFARGGEFFVRNCVFEKSGAGGCGGAIRAYDAVGSVQQTLFDSCTALDGGAICLDKSVLTVTGCSFLNNRATIWGGVIFGDSSNLFVSSSRFIGNVGQLGGVFNFNLGELMQVKYSVFRDNSAEYDGSPGIGGVGTMWLNDSVTFENCIFENNSAGVAAALHCSTSTTLKECVFVDETDATLLQGYDFRVEFSDFWPQPAMGPYIDSSIARLVTVNQNGDSVDAFGNLVAPPDFLPEAAGQGEYYPNFLSPLIDAGDTTDGLEWDGTYPEIGLRSYLHIPPVEDLTILRVEGTDDLMLNWSQPVPNCTYRAYRCAANEWDWDAVEIVGQTADTFFVHQNALSSPLDMYTYRVSTIGCEMGR